jgi:hypothetical protein
MKAYKYMVAMVSAMNTALAVLIATAVSTGFLKAPTKSTVYFL